MTESNPTTRNDDRDPFVEITQALRADTDLSARIEAMLQELVAAESWETIGLRSTERAQRQPRELVPGPVRVSAVPPQRPRP